MNSFQTFSFSYELSDSSTEDCMSDDDHFEDFPLPSFNTSNDDFPTPKSYHRNSSPTLYTPHTQSPPSIEIARRDLSPFCTESATFSPISPFTTSQKPIPILPLPTPEDNLLRTPVKEKEEKHVTILVPTPDFSNLKESNFADRKLTRTSSSNGIMPETPKKRGCQRSRLSHTPVTPARAPIHSPVHFSHKLTPKVNDNEVNKHLELHFDQLEKIGAGSFSNVFKARCIDDNTWYAIKILKRPLSSDSQRVKLIQELKIVKQMDHPHVLNYIFCWEQNQIPHFQMEMCSGGSLSHYMTSWQKMNRGRYFEESLLWKFLTDIALGLYHIHSHGIIHHDLKPGNIFVDAEGNLKIGDFGLADFESSSADTAEGDSRYLAPEVLDDIVSKAADIFSFGASIFELACLIEMPSADEPWNVLRSGNVSALPKFPTYSKEFKNLVDSMMHPQYDVRPTIEDILSYPNVLANIECRKLTKGNEYMNKIFMSKPITPSLPSSEIQPISQRDFTCTTQRKARYKRNLMNDLVGL